MCGISLEVHDAFHELDELNHRSSINLRLWSGPTLVEERNELKELHKFLSAEHASRTTAPASGLGKGKGGNDKRRKVQYEYYKNW